MNSFVPPNSKVSHLGAVTNKVILFILGLLLVFCALGLMAYILWDSRDRAQDGILKHWYLIGDSGYSLVFFTFLILFNAFIPISLYVTMEVVKIVQVYFMVNDLAMYDEERDIPAQANTSALNEDLGQVQYVFSDKTGTLTENVMEFRLFSVAGQAFKHPSVGRRNDAADATVLIQDLSSARAQGYRLNPFRQQCFDFLLAMALCHSAIPDLSQARIDNDMPPFNSEERVPNNHTQNAIVYQSSSADEVAIVNAARDLTFLYKNRTPTSVVLNILNEPTDTEFELLNILEFTSDRKRMSTIYKYPDGRIMLLVKGADNVILERISSAPLNEDQFRIKASILQDVGAFATEGLRTLLYAYRELDSSFYNQWNVRYADALASITNRVANVSAVAEELERELILLGATAIEDKLQEGVPETIETLRKAGIRVWMLTGDKTETAVNIGRTCNLIKKETHVMLLNDETCPLGKGKPLESEVAAISNWVTSTTANFKQLKLQMPNCHILVAVEGRMLTKLEKMAANNQIGGNEETPTFKSLLDLLIAADNVICCRFSPSQKALLVRLVKSRLSKQHHTKGGASELLEELSGGAPSGWSKLWSTLILKPRPSGVTLAIGDGANDIPMLLCAHVGIGITGREGLAASRASDYSIAKFKFLQPLLFVHGRWSYVRICLFTLGTLYKNITFYGTQLVFQFFCGYSGTSLYEQWTLSLNNVLFTSLPVMIVGVFEKDLNRSTLMAVPELYRYGQMNRGFNFRVQLRWLLQGFLHAALSVVLPAILYGGFSWTGGNQTFSTPLFFYANTPTWVKEVFQSDGSGPYQESALYPLGTISYTITVLFCTIKVLYVECHYITGIHHFIGLLTFFVWIAYQFVYSYVWQPHSAFGPDTAYEYSGLYYSLIHSQIRFWGVVILSVVIGLIVEDVSVKFLEMLGRMVRWGAGGGRKSKIVVLETSAEPSKLKDSDPLSQEARIAASHAVGEHDWADEVEWWQRWEQLRMRRYR
ncbi:hypothetical protein HDU82_006675 [Entophlyctis luteolus]|nr:hypothetical protein HDU82_006675 [Entophlyctis luteolus]